MIVYFIKKEFVNMWLVLKCREERKDSVWLPYFFPVLIAYIHNKNYTIQYTKQKQMELKYDVQVQDEEEKCVSVK